MRRCPSLRGFVGSVLAGLVFLAALAPIPALAVEPTGYLDVASCDTIGGWSQDPDEPAKPIAVHIYFGGPAGTPGAPAVGTVANIYREDLCAAIGSCEHGFYILPPLSLLDGQPRAVHAYGIDSQGGPNPELGASPKQLACAPPPPVGVRRKVADVKSFAAWRFQSFWDLLPLGPAEADALPDGPDMPSAPELIRADDGSDAIWLVDRGVRRAIPGGAFATWRFDIATVQTRPAGEVSAMIEGTAVRPRPVVFIRGTLFVVDDPQPEVPSTSSGSGGGGGAGGAGGSSSGAGAEGGAGPADPPPGDGDGSCAYRAPAADPERALPYALLAGFLFVARTGRRRAPRS